jgi:ribosomal protein S18 acetylase RimI-like enzyme
VPLPETFDDAPNAGLEVGAAQVAAEASTAGGAALVRRVLVPRLVREAIDRGWWDPLVGQPAQPGAPDHTVGSPRLLDVVDADLWSRLTLAPWVIAPAAPADGHAVVLAALRDGATVGAAVVGTRVVGLGLAVDGALLTLGVAPRFRRAGLGRSLLGEFGPEVVSAEVTVAERDPFDPVDGAIRAEIAARMLGTAGFSVRQASDEVGAIDPSALVARR